MAAIHPKINLPPEAMPFGRDVYARLDRLEADAERRAQGEVNSNRQQNATLGLLGVQVRALPIMGSGSTTSTGFGLSAGWNSHADVSLVVPDGKTIATILAVGGSAVVDMTSGGLTSASARIVIDGVPSVPFPAAKDAGANAVNNIMSPSLGTEITVAPGDTITVSLQINPLLASAFPAEPANFASLTVIAIFAN